MKNQVIKTIFFLVLTIYISIGMAQPQWKFHIAFEDATGAKDTIWLVYDTTAHGTLPTDTLLGEGKVVIDYSKFNVYIFNYDNDTTKTFALPYFYFPGHNAYIYALNYQYPITVSWDTSLFHASFLPVQQGVFNIARMDNDYFFAINNCLGCQYFDMLMDDSAFAPAFSWGSASQFPLDINLLYDPTIGLNTISKEQYKIFPNPVTDNLRISIKNHVDNIQLSDLTGTVFKEYRQINSDDFIISMKDIPNGMYIIQITDNSKNQYHEKIIKTN